MAFYAGRVILHPAAQNPTVVVLTDRNDLDDQLCGRSPTTVCRLRTRIRAPEDRMQEPESETVDVVAIMSEIRESIRRKRQQGIYTDEESESLALQRLRSYAQEAQIDPRLVDALMGPSHDWNIAADYSIQTTRSGPVAFLLVAAKKLARPFVRLYTDHLIKRQAQINLYFAHLLHNTVRETARQQIEMQALRHRLSVLEAKPGSGAATTE